MTTFTIAPSDHQRAMSWVQNHLYEICKVRQTRDHSYYAEPDGRIVESCDRYAPETVGSWRMDGENLVVEIEDY